MADHNCASHGPCPVPPHPDALKAYLESESKNIPTSHRHLSVDQSITRPYGLNDGTLSPPRPKFDGSRRESAKPQPPLRGTLRLLIVLTSFKDVPLRPDAAQHFKNIFFSRNEVKPGNNIKTGSVAEYYEEVSGGLVTITGDIYGPYVLPETVGFYAQDGWGSKNKAADDHTNNPNAQTMADHALDALLKDQPGIDLRQYDNPTRPGSVDGFVVVHAGEGGELHLGEPEKYIWSVQWALKKQRFVGKSNTGVYAFLTLPEDARTGVCAHELGHLVFQWPDLYGKTLHERGVGHWCVMSNGSWNTVPGAQAGDVPCHPSAWLKMQQGWIEVQKAKGSLKSVLLNDVKATVNGGIKLATNSKGVGGTYRLWTKGNEFGNEFFLIETRTHHGFDASLPGEGLLIWHIQDNRTPDELYNFKVTLLNADFQSTGMPVSHEKYIDGPGCPFPGTAGNRSFTGKTTPSSVSYKNEDTMVSVTNISDAGPTMSMDLSVEVARAKL
ncbi:immune inhibitor A [Echria macrotheca]|uniref:Immune inhibitor A n=1 Tax=Echria macrotheca TaxID=438768 RepID=A0AAJ0BLD0_9PEZI|nr:immune inhibitor A [Echria macrotheca]